jgi:polar amino acid transport system substrate-binding protein
MLTPAAAGAATMLSASATRSASPTSIVSSLNIKETVALNALLPASIRSSGTLTIATDPEAPPYESYNANNTVLVGGDIDLATAIAEVLGLKPKFTAISFAGIIPAIESGRFNLGISAMGDTPAREAEVTFVDYSTDGNALIVKAGNPENIKSMADLCGKTVAVLQGSVMLGLVQAQNNSCTKKITASVFASQSSAYLAVAAGRADATITDAAVASNFIATQKNLKLQVLTFHTYGEGYNAIPMQKANLALVLCVQQALMRLMMNGDYHTILSAWNMAAGGVKWPTVNDGLRFNQPTG